MFDLTIVAEWEGRIRPGAPRELLAAAGIPPAAVDAAAAAGAGGSARGTIACADVMPDDIEGAFPLTLA
jgi:hypothetical protein